LQKSLKKRQAMPIDRYEILEPPNAADQLSR